MSPEERLKRTKVYARDRLRQEIERAPRGIQARLATALNISTAHVANLKNNKALPGEEVLPRLAAHWGMTYDELVTLATGVPESAARDTVIQLDVMLPNFAEVGGKHGYSMREIEHASHSIRGRAGTSDLPDTTILELLAEARIAIRHAERIIDIMLIEQTGDDDLPGGMADARQRFRRKREKPKR